ncbi:NAD-dependent epimerase/dehydratase family protein [uncultured Sphingomonas sp.]|uniref:NAD-dependent epimerase/dehydratase family protein n=1 Tax=uncultured Sphingomonas sp. TaxID=158754 RepID=UPI0035CBBFDF
MLGKDARILVVGGGSRIAAALAPLLGDAATYVVRRPAGRPRQLIVADYGDIPAATLDGVECLINCTGASTGGAAHLDAVNVDMPRRLAVAASAAGVRHLVHVSSFSVYGGAHVIDRNTPVAPTSDYGRSKLAADTALLALADDRLSVTILRLPLIYGRASLGKLGQLMRLWAQIRVLPVPSGDVVRAMIGVDLSAQVVARLTAEPRTGVVFAADPRPFTYADAAQAWARAGKGTLHRLSIPRPLARFIERAAPAIGGRLFADSRLADDDNLAIRYGLASRLYRDIALADLH